MKNYLICYDILDKKRLYKVRKIAYSYALGGQKSTLEAPLDLKLLHNLIDKLKRVIKDEDKINIIEYIGEPICYGNADYLKYDKGLIII